MWKKENIWELSLPCVYNFYDNINCTYCDDVACLFRSPEQKSPDVLTPLQDWLRKGGRGSMRPSGPIQVLFSHLQQAKQIHKTEEHRDQNKEPSCPISWSQWWFSFSDQSDGCCYFCSERSAMSHRADVRLNQLCGCGIFNRLLLWSPRHSLSLSLCYALFFLLLCLLLHSLQTTWWWWGDTPSLSGCLD